MKRLLTKNSKRVIARIAILAVAAVLIAFFLEWRFFGNNSARTWTFVTEKFPVFIYNALLIFFLELVVSVPFKTPWTGAGITFAFFIIVAYITTQKQAFRGQPLLPEDFMLADQTGTITKFINFGSLVRTILAVVLALALMLILNHLTKRFFEPKDKKEPKNFWRKNIRWLRAIMLVVGVVGFVKYTDFARVHSGEKYEETFLGSTFIAWNQMWNYEENGFVLGFMYNWSKFELSAPSGYSEEKLAEIKTEYSAQKSGENSLEKSDYNVVVILNESFYDPNEISEYYPIKPNKDLKKNSMDIPVTEDVIPTIRNLIETSKTSKKHVTGKMYTIDYGGGTANIEFEVDTSMSTYFVNTTPFVDLIPRTESVPSIASIAKSAGYKTIAIHPFNSGMYKRNISLKKEGFDAFIDEETISFKEKDDEREYINDRSAYNETLKALSENEEKTLVSLITMQNHASYDYGYTTKSYLLGDAPKIGEDKNPFSDYEKGQVETYLESLHNSDYYLSEFLNKLEKMDEKTVVLFYGDHSPGVFTRVNSAKSEEISRRSYYTPYFVWANFELENKTAEHLKTTTPNCLVPTTFSLLNLEKTPNLKLTEAVCNETPILAHTYYSDSAPFRSTTLSNYELYIYDILGGERYFLK